MIKKLHLILTKIPFRQKFVIFPKDLKSIIDKNFQRFLWKKQNTVIPWENPQEGGFFFTFQMRLAQKKPHPSMSFPEFIQPARQNDILRASFFS